MILNYAILNGALGLLPDSLASMAIQEKARTVDVAQVLQEVRA